MRLTASMPASIRLAMLCKDRGKIQVAVESYGQAMLLAPSDAGNYVGLGDSLREQGEIEAALEMYQRAFDVEPDLIGIHSHLLFTMLPPQRCWPSRPRVQRTLSFPWAKGPSHRARGRPRSPRPRR